jgi:hypothetical protein
MCLRLTSFFGKLLFNLINTDKYHDVSSTTSEEDSFSNVPQSLPNEKRYNLRQRAPVNYFESSDAYLDTSQNSDEE